MKVTHLQAEDVHGYLRIDVKFREDLTFLTGLNGCGKTSALRILMALLTPRIEELALLSLHRATLKVSDSGRETTVEAKEESDGMSLSVSGVETPLLLSSADLQLLAQPRSREEANSPVHEKISKHAVFSTIAKMSTPMFLGLDRRLSGGGTGIEDPEEDRRRFFLSRRLTQDPIMRRNFGAELTDANYLVVSQMQRIRAAQERLDESLRRKILTKAFEYKPSVLGADRKFPSLHEIERYRERLAHIEKAAENLHLPGPELKSTLVNFFERMNRVVSSLEKNANAIPLTLSDEPQQEFIEWIVNMPQADRILEHVKLLDEYGSSRTSLREPIDKFVSLANGFLKQTNKDLRVNSAGELTVHREGSGISRPISALSSGERQIVVMLAHLSLNPNLKSGVFIVDEPELSLHIDWQEKFVDAIREANPKVQLIMATHSPAIILDRVAHCVSLS